MPIALTIYVYFIKKKNECIQDGTHLKVCKWKILEEKLTAIIIIVIILLTPKSDFAVKFLRDGTNGKWERVNFTFRDELFKRAGKETTWAKIKNRA